MCSIAGFRKGGFRMRLTHCLFVAILVSAMVLAQDAGSINGTVTDSSGAVIPGVTVTVTSPALQGVQTFVTNEQGLYRFPTLPIGIYKIAYEGKGFNAVVREQVTVTNGFNATINVTLNVALNPFVTVTC